MGDTLVGFAVYVTAFAVLLLVLGILERLWPERNQSTSGGAKPVPESIKYRNAS